MKKVFFMISLCFLAGCSLYRIDSEDTTLDFYPPKRSAQEVVYLETVNKPYEVIGVVALTAERNRPQEEIVEKMREEAAILGGDAITDLRSDAGREKAPEILANAYIRVRYSAKVIVFK